MKCPYCGEETLDTGKFCEVCGRELPRKESGMNQQQAQLLTGAGSAAFAIGKAARTERLEADYSNETIISSKLYNLIIAGVLLWGLVINALLCTFVGDVYRYINPVLFLILYIACAASGIIICGKSKDPVKSFIGYNMVVIPFGLVISTLVDYYGGIDATIVRHAFVYTALVTTGMLCAAVAFPEFLAKLGGALTGCLIGVIICEVVLALFGVQQTVTDWITAGIFSLYIAYDFYRSQQFEKTVDNAVDCALDIYLDIANLFIRLLEILAKSKKKDD